MKRRLLAAAAAALIGTAAPAAAWSLHGHQMIDHIAAQELPASMPAFLHTPMAIFTIGMLGPEPDDLKGSGKSWDGEYDPGHYLDLLDDGTVAPGVQLDDLPPTREAYDTVLRKDGTDQYRQGYLPYSILDGWEQLRTDFAYWRVDSYQSTHGSASSRAMAARRESVEQMLILRDIGVWGHYVGDASQPLHVTVHFNGWGKYPDPQGYTQKPIHSFFETDFVDRYETLANVAPLAAAIPRRPAPEGAPISQRTMQNAIALYLRMTNEQVPQVYQLYAAGSLQNGSPNAVRFVGERLAQGAAELRDLVTWAWDDSLNVKIGYPQHTVRSLIGE